MLVNNNNKNNNKQFILGKGLVKKTNFVHSNVHCVQLPERKIKNQRFFQVKNQRFSRGQPYIEHNSNKIGNIQLIDKNTKEVKELNKTLHVNKKMYLTKFINGGEKSKNFPSGTQNWVLVLLNLIKGISLIKWKTN